MAKIPLICSNPPLLNFTKVTKSIGEIKDEEQVGNPQRTSRSRSSMFPSLREDID
jgi:hypothetical protein